MRLGALLGPMLGDAAPNQLAEQARTLAGEGFASLWAAQAIGRGFMVSDPFIVLAVAATAVEQAELGTAIVQLPLYHPLDFAHRAFSLQQICGDRLVLGLGAGSTEGDFNAFSRNFDQRFADFRQGVRDLREIFKTGGLGDAKLFPWPAVAGGPPLFLGSWGRGVDQAAKDFDGWIASAMYRSPDEVTAALGRYRDAGGGRAVVSTIQVSAGTDLGELKAKLAQFAQAGFDDAVLLLMPGAPPPGELRKLLP